MAPPEVLRYRWSTPARLGAAAGVLALLAALADMARGPAKWGLSEPILLVLGTLGLSVAGSTVLVGVLAGAATLDRGGVWVRGINRARLVRWADLAAAGADQHPSGLLLLDGRVVDLRFVLPPAEQRRLRADVAAGLARRSRRPTGQAGRPAVWPARVVGSLLVGAGASAAWLGWQSLLG